MPEVNKCQDCIHYVNWKNYSPFCGYEERNEFNHTIKKQGNLEWNKYGKCRKFEQKLSNGISGEVKTA